ncbi:MAG: ATP-binding protein [Collinsella sp.]
MLRSHGRHPRERHGRGYSRRQAGEKIFERFYRLGKSLQRAGRHGLGLAIVKHAALYHGGEVSVESEEDVSTRFTVRLPIG